MSRWLTAALAVLVVTAIAASDQRVLPGEVAVLEAANDIPTALGWPLRVVMQLGTLWAALVVVAAVAIRTLKQGLVPAVATFVAVLLAFRLDNLLKDVIDRPRPEQLVDGVRVREEIGGFGFPSGHTTMACALAAALHPLLPPFWRRVAWAGAAIVAIARMHVGVHLPLDLVGGAALGTAIGAAAWLAVGRAPSCWFERPQ